MVLLLRHNFSHKTAREKMFFHVFWTVVLFSENIETNYILILPLKKKLNHES